MASRKSTSRKSARRRRPVAVPILVALLVFGFVAPRLVGDDRALLLQNTGDPYLFVLLDNSMSMTLTMDDRWVHANGNDPRSRIYQAKEVLYEELKDLPGEVKFGFATFNQDQLYVQSKHFLYYAKTDQRSKVNTLGIDYPTVEEDTSAPFGGDDRVEYKVDDGSGNFDTVVDIDGDMMTFGQTFGGEGGSCDDPLRLNIDAERERANRFSKLGADSREVTVIWVRDSGKTYRVSFDGNPGLVKLGAAEIKVKVTVERLLGNDCSNPTFAAPVSETVTFTLWREFLMTDDGSGEVVFAQSGVNAGKEEAEKTGGFAEWRDAQGDFDCGDSKPFSGGGWEGNYDTGRPFATRMSPSDPSPFEESIPGYDSSKVDTHCAAPLTDCQLHLETTTFDGAYRELDRGDVLPFHWSIDNKTEFLKRLNPNHGIAAPKFGASPYFEDEPDSTGRLRLRNAAVRPLVPMGASPLTDAIHDFRCWYAGPGKDKCKAKGNDNRGNVDDVYTVGFQKILEDTDQALAECRRPFLIIISDMAVNCPGNSPVATVAGMHSNTGGGDLGVSTWVFNVGTGNVTGLVNAGKGEEIKVDSKAKLREELKKVIGLFQEESSSFASAAVPSVQADVEDKIYLTQFTPRQDSSVWEGEVHAFVKPLPLNPDGTPNDSIQCDTTTVDGCHVWNAAEELKAQAPDPDTDDLSLPLDRSKLRIGDTATQRRLFYAIGDTDPSNDADGDGFPDNDTDVKVPRARSYFGPYKDAADRPTGVSMDLNQLRKDLWLGMRIVDEAFTFTDPVNQDHATIFTNHNAEATEAHATFRGTFAQKKVLPRDEDGNPVPPEVKYVLGDIFHATPQLVGNPGNGRYLARPDRFPGYEDYFNVQARRRKVLFIASNDGQLHAFDAGRFARSESSEEDPNVSVVDGRFNNGTGIELFAYTPRPLLERLKTLADSSIGHEWGLDGTPAVSDVRIDPLHRGAGSFDPPKEDDRQWRTVLVGGMRRGGRGYYALDVTRPDKMVEEIASGGPLLGWKPADPVGVVPGCLEATGTPGASIAECDGLGYPAVLWELTDPDMGDTWSSPDLGAIEVLDANGDKVLKYVAIFGGGMDPDGRLREANVTLGRMLYIVDVETGQMLYKRRLEGAAAAAPAAVDTDQDGLLDRIYIGTTEGLMYRVDIDTAQELKLGNACPLTPPAGSSDLCCVSAAGPTNGCVIAPEWEPYVVFDTGVGGDPVTRAPTRKPIFFAPAVIFSSQLGRFALAFGTGNREDLWAPLPVPAGASVDDYKNRYYLFVDDSDVIDRTDASLFPFHEGRFVPVTDAQIADDDDFLQNASDGSRGWFLELGNVPASNGISVVPEKVLTPATAISGLNVFSTFVPQATGISASGPRCARRGISRVYSQFTDNSLEIPPTASDGSVPPECASPPCDRHPVEIETLVSEPFIEQADQPCAGTEEMARLLKEKIFPKTCNFASYRWNLSAMRADTGIECLAQIPVCIIEKNWKDY